MIDLDEVRANLTAIADFAELAPGEVEPQAFSVATKATTNLIHGVPDMVLAIEELRNENEHLANWVAELKTSLGEM